MDLFYVCIYIFMNVAKIKTLQEPKSSKTLLNPNSVNIFMGKIYEHIHICTYINRHTYYV